MKTLSLFLKITLWHTFFLETFSFFKHLHARAETSCVTLKFYFRCFRRVPLLPVQRDRMWMTNIVGLCLLALAVSAEDKKLSSYATTLADNSANLAFRSEWKTWCGCAKRVAALHCWVTSLFLPRSLYHKMAKDKGVENIAISPVVVASSLGMVALGAKANTASQVKAVLSADTLKDEHLHAGLSELLSEVRSAAARQTFSNCFRELESWLTPLSHAYRSWVTPRNATRRGRSATACTGRALSPSLTLLWKAARSTTTTITPRSTSGTRKVLLTPSMSGRPSPLMAN